VKLALVTRRYPPEIGGAERVLSYLAAGLQRAGAGVTVVTSDRDGGADDRGSPVPVVRLATSRARFVGTWMYMRGLARWLERERVDLAYVSMLKHDAYVAVGVGARRGFPVVLRPEGAGATGDLAWQGWGRFGRAIGRRCRRADAVVAISAAIRGELIARGYEESRIVDLPNGVPVPDEAWVPREGWRAAPRAVFVGRLAAEKGLGTLVDAWPIVRREYPGATLALVGEGPERAGLEARIAASGMPAGAVELPGAVADPGPWLRGADLFVLPSIEEGMSIALLEAMALGMPLVASDIAGNRRLVDDRETGRLVPPGDPRAWAAAIRDQWGDFERACEQGRAARRLVERSYSINAVAHQHLLLFESLIAARRGGAARR